MIDIIQDERKEYALLIGFQQQEQSADGIAEELDELAELVRNVGLVPLAPEIVKVREMQVQYGIGSGRAGEIARIAQECEADCLVFDAALTPSQQRNWERLARCPILDREEIILEIFARRAQTREAVLQVELARAQYALPRVTRAWTHLSRQRGGGATTRGEGEAQIETDRRLLRRKIQQLHTELEQVRRCRNTQRKARCRRPVPQGAIVGYTNVGKSSLLQALSGAEVMVKDQLFATLDPLARQVALPDNTALVLIDTVGFVRKLPHTLVEAFKSTLEEAVLADFLLLVLDVSSPRLDAEWETTLGVLRELGAEEKKIQIVFNKCDVLDERQDAVLLARLRGLFPGALYVSARTGLGMEALRTRLTELARANQQLFRLALPPERGDLAALAHQAGAVCESRYDDNGVLHMVCTLDPKVQSRFAEYQES